MKDQVLALCDALRIPTGRCERVGGRSWSWDGSVLDVESRFDGWMGTNAPSDSVHDVAHWLLCEPRRRRRPEFGLGTGVDSRSRCAKRTVDLRDAVEEEACASVLGILMERAAGWPWQDTWELHSWSTQSLRDLVGHRRELRIAMSRRRLQLPHLLELARVHLSKSC